MFQPTPRLTPPMPTSTPMPSSAPIPIKQRHRSSFSQARKRRPSESAPRLVHPEDRDRLTSSKFQASISPAITTTATFTTTPSGALALSLSPPGLNSGLSKSAPLENEGLSGQSHRRKGTTFRCETCAKVYRHPSCLVKHRWEHSPHWHEASKFLLSKHQQVQLLEAAAILSHLSPATAGGTSLPEDRSLWPSYLSGGLLPLPPGHTNLIPNIASVASNPSFGAVIEVDSSSGDASAHVHLGTALGVKVEASPEMDVPAKSEDSTSEEDEEDGDDVEIEDVESDTEVNIDIDVDIEGDVNEDTGENLTRHRLTRSSVSSSNVTADFTETYPTVTTTTRARTSTPGLSITSSTSSTPKPLPTPGTATIPARAGLTELRPGLLGHPNPPTSSVLPTQLDIPSPQSLVNTSSQAQRAGTSPVPSPWSYGYSQSRSGTNGYAIVSQSSVPSSIPSIPQPSSHLNSFSMSAPLSVPPFSHLHGHHTASYSPSTHHHHYAFSPSYSPVGSISGPFASLSLSSPLSYAGSALDDGKQTKGLGLPRSSVRSSSGSSDDEEMDKDGDMSEDVYTGLATNVADGPNGRCNSVDQALVNANTSGNGGEWEMEI